MKGIKGTVFGALGIGCALLAGFILVEAGFRAYLYATTKLDATFPGVMIMDRPLPETSHILAPGNVFGQFSPSTVYRMSHYLPNNRALNPHFFHTNNLGWVSHYDYAVEKPADEFRIAVIGASLVLNITNENPWTDALQRYLNADEKLRALLGVRKITVMSFGFGGAAFQTMIDPGLVTALRFDPDFIVVNFATENVAMPVGAPMPAVTRDTPAIIAQRPKTYLGKPVSTFEVDGVHIDLMCPAAVTQSISHPQCLAGLQWSIDWGKQPEELSERIGAIKQDVARAIMRKRVLLSPFPISVYHVLGYPVFPKSVAPNAPTENGVNISLKAFQAIRNAHADVLFVHNPIEQDLVGDIERSKIVDALLTAALTQGHDMVKMEDYLPIQFGKAEVSRWYIKNDGHWSDYGAEVYGRAMHLTLRNRLLASRGLHAAWDDEACSQSRAHFKKATSAAQLNDRDSQIREYEQAVALLPANVSDFYLKNNGYGTCNFVPWLLGDYSFALGRDPRAEETRQKALALASDGGYDFHRRRAALRKAYGAPIAAIQDYDEMIKIRPDSAEALQARAEATLSLNDPVQAEKDYTALLQLTPDNFGAIFGRAQARILIQDFKGTLSDANRLIEQYPKEGAFFYVRAVAKDNLGRLEDALKDLESALQLAPHNSAASALRASILGRLATKPHH
jgi:tetratricopeptide (TPR) repeat protein